MGMLTLHSICLVPDRGTTSTILDRGVAAPAPAPTKCVLREPLLNTVLIYADVYLRR